MAAIKKAIAILATLATILSCFAIMADAASISVVNGRSDGNWLFPLASSYYQSISDWAGCYANGGTIGACPFHGKSCGHNAACDADHYTGHGPYGHNGIDIKAAKGAAVMASAPGTLYYVNYNLGARGLTAVIEHKTNSKDSYYSYYQHLNGINTKIKSGSTVNAGDIIGYVGNTGGNYGNHLHFGMVFGQAGKGSNAATGEYLNTLEGYGWLTTSDYKYGRIVVNPDVKNADTRLDTVNSHRGSVHYVFNKSEVKIGSCSYILTDYESAHPHKAIYKCKDCGKTYTDAAKTKYNSNCKQCTETVFNTNGITKPSTIRYASCFGLKGTITCNKTMTNITAGIYTDSAGKNPKQRISMNPNSKTYNLNGKVNDSLVLNNLDDGTYYYRVTATAPGKTEIIVNQKFNVYTVFTISNATKPTSIKKGSCFGLRGVISNDKKLKNVTAGIYSDANGKNAKQKVSVNPNAKSYNLNGKINNELIFNNLPKGTYYYKVTANNGTRTETLINQKFTVT
ncbi:MAG: peptidoglycan DD-metalloendopeptidase family protein [Clostridia bacterium]|nr:peptidoglycan DD-metalloendopeptidase family protein [Clostridia bacterium]